MKRIAKHRRQKQFGKFTVVFEPAEEGGYFVTVPAIPGCYTQAETFEEAQKNAKEVIQLCVSVHKQLALC